MAFAEIKAKFFKPKFHAHFATMQGRWCSCRKSASKK